MYSLLLEQGSNQHLLSIELADLTWPELSEFGHAPFYLNIWRTSCVASMPGHVIKGGSYNSERTLTIASKLISIA